MHQHISYPLGFTQSMPSCRGQHPSLLTWGVRFVWVSGRALERGARIPFGEVQASERDTFQLVTRIPSPSQWIPVTYVGNPPCFLWFSNAGCLQMQGNGSTGMTKINSQKFGCKKWQLLLQSNSKLLGLAQATKRGLAS